jgi:superfamily I DNA/RNA helicase
MNIKPSIQQQAIINEIKNPTSQHMLIEAVAGSGKTVTIELAMQELDTLHRAQYLAFNKSNVNDIITRIGEDDKRIEVATFNSTGFRTLRRNLDFNIKVQSFKTYNMLDTYSDVPDDRYIRNCIVRLVSLAKNNMIKPQHKACELHGLLNYMGMCIDESDLVVLQASHCLRDNWEYTQEHKVIDFDDMLYLPLLLNIPFRKKTHLFIDECQDTNNANFEMIKRMLTSKGRCFMVGDSHQSIYGFRGATIFAMDRMGDYFNAGKLPLSTTYRCAKSIVKLAQQFVPEIEARPGAPEGIVIRDKTFNLSELKPLDMILCRVNAPLMSVAWKLLRAGKPFNMLGKDLQSRLERIIQKVQKKDEGMLTDNFMPLLWDYVEKQEKKLKKQDAYGLIHTLNDEADCLAHLCTICSTIEAVKDTIIRIFRLEYGIKLSTVHKVKGMEAPHVVILNASKYMPFKKATTVWELQQEDNIYYVAVTRAKNKLTFADSEDLI